MRQTKQQIPIQQKLETFLFLNMNKTEIHNINVIFFFKSSTIPLKTEACIVW